jgi:O-antigen/teichoic acid export membrane protein
MPRLNLKILSSDFFRSAAILSGGTALAQVITLAASPLITRIYSSADFGAFQLYQSVLNFMVIAGAFRFEIAILIAEDEDEALDISILCFFITLALFALFLLLGFAIYFNLLGIQEYLLPVMSFIWFLPITFLLSTFILVLTNLNLRNKTFKKITVAKITQSATNTSTQLIAGFFQLKPTGLFIGDLAGKLFCFIQLFKTQTKLLIIHAKKINTDRLKVLFIKHKEFFTISAPGALLNVAGFAIPNILIGTFFGLKVLGFYALVDRLFAAPSILIGQSVSQVYVSDINKALKNNPNQILVNFKRLIRFLGILSFIPLLIFSFIAPSVFSFVFGEEWREAGFYFCILAPMQFVSFMVWPLMPTLALLNKQKWQFFWELSRSILTTIALILVHYFNLGPRFAIGSFSIVMLIAYAVHLLLSYQSIKLKIHSFKIKDIV